MPITLAPASPLGSAASIGIGAGVAEQNAKMFPTLASLYSHIASLRSQGGGGGGHGGGGGGGIQVLPRDDGGALYQVEAQANREQRSQEQANFLGQPDYVLGHIKERENFQLQQQREADQAITQREAAMNAPSRVAPQWGQAEQDSLLKANQAVAGLKKEVEAGSLGEETGKMVMAPYQDKIEALTKQQEDYQQYQRQKAFQTQSDGMAFDRALIDTDTKAAAATGYRAVPDLPTPIMKVDRKTGKEYMANEVVYKAAASAREKAMDHNHKLDLEAGKRQAEVEKAERAADDHYIKIYQKVQDRVDKDEDEFIKGAGPGDMRKRKNYQERAAEIGAALEAMGLPKSLEGFRDSRKSAGRPQVGGSKEAAKTADPEVLGSFQSHIATMPRTSNGTPDLQRLSPEQLDQLAGYYKNYKAIGVSEANAAKWVQAITVAKANQAAPANDFEHTPPTTNRFARGASNIANEVPDVADRLGAGAKRIGGDVYEDVVAPIGAGAQRVSGINRETVNDIGSDIGFLGETASGAARQAGSVVGSVVDRIERGGANTYDVFKRWLGK